MSRSFVIFSPDDSKLDPSSVKELSTENAQTEWENHPRNARNWSTRRKWITLGVTLLYTLVPHIGETVLPPGLRDIAQQYHVKNPSVNGLIYSVKHLAYALGPLVLAPLSEMYGRKWVLDMSMFLSLVFNLACAFSPNVGVLIMFRFLSGISANAPASIIHGTIGDLFYEDERMTPQVFLNIAGNISNFFGPSLGGLIVYSLGAKWLFIIPAVTFAVACVVGIPLLEDSFGPKIRQRQAKKTVDPEAAIKTSDFDCSQRSELGTLWFNMKRPLVMLCRSSICFGIGIYLMIISGVRSLLFLEFASVFKDTYGFHTQTSGLTYFGFGTGMLLSTFVSARVGNYIYKKGSERNGGKGTPEMRMPLAVPGILFVTIGLLWFGWSAEARLHWMMPIIGMGFFGFGLIAIYIPLYLYLIDTFHIYAASATAATSVFYCLADFGFPLFGAQMYDRLGVGGGTTLLAALALILGIPILLWLYYNGEAVRARSRSNYY